MIHNRGSNKVVVLYSVILDWMKVGLGQRLNSDKHSASIFLYYPADTLSQVKKVAEEIVRRGIIPEVYLKRGGNAAYISVLFHLKPLTEEFLRLLGIEKISANVIGKIRAGHSELVMTGESEFPLEDLNPFFDAYEKDGYFHLYIMDRTGAEGEAVWGVRLEHIHEGLPDIRSRTA